MKKQFIIYIGIALILLIGGILVWKETVKAPIDDRVTPTQPTTPTIPTPTQTEPTEPTIPIEPTTPVEPIKTPQGWKTYENKELAFALKYPENWLVYDEAKLIEDEKREPCRGLLERKTVILSHKDLGDCVGIIGDYWPGDFLILPSSNRCITATPHQRPKGSKVITVNGIPALKYTWSQLVIVEIGHENACYHIEFIQTDEGGNYDPIYDQILASFKFIN